MFKIIYLGYIAYFSILCAFCIFYTLKDLINIEISAA